jgi:hypothetical protein
MHDTWIHDLQSWHEFFLLIGTAGVTLTGLLFVVISLGPRLIANHQATGVRAFISPNAVFFSSTLVVSAVFMMPALPERVLGWLLVVGAAASVGYMAYTRAHQQWRQNQLPVLDWVWFVGLPLAAYLVLLAAGVSFLMHGALSFLLVAAGLILLLVIGIRNAWDLVIWVSQKEHSDKPEDADQEATPPAG